MSIFRFFNNRAKRLGIIDIKLVQSAVFLIGIIAAKIFPEILRIDTIWFILFAAIFAIRPLYTFLKSE